MGAFLFLHRDYEDIPQEEYLLGLISRFNSYLCKLEDISGISFKGYSTTLEIETEYLNEWYGENASNTVIRNRFIKLECKAERKFMNYMTKYKALSKEQVREILSSERTILWG